MYNTIGSLTIGDTTISKITVAEMKRIHSATQIL